MSEFKVKSVRLPAKMIEDIKKEANFQCRSFNKQLEVLLMAVLYDKVIPGDRKHHAGEDVQTKQEA